MSDRCYSLDAADAFYPTITSQLILHKAAEALEPIPAVTGRGAGYILDRWSVHHEADI